MKKKEQILVNSETYHQAKKIIREQGDLWMIHIGKVVDAYCESVIKKAEKNKNVVEEKI